MTDSFPPTYPSGIPRVNLHSGDGGEVLVLTGMSGAGRTRAAGVLGDLGWYVVDNLPPHMLGELVTTLMVRGDAQRLAAVVDARGGPFFGDLESVVDDLEVRGTSVRLVFLDADDATLVRRFEEARRPHPLQGEGTLLEGIHREREVVQPLREDADFVVDTSRLSVHDLRQIIGNRLADRTPELHVNVMSFGFKNGIPTDADFVADVRFLPNPHWDPALRDLTGLDDAVKQAVFADPGAEAFVSSYATLISDVLQQYRAHDRVSVTVAIGCTGGKHRSVAVAEALGLRLTDAGHAVRVTHRDRPQV